MQEDLKYCCSSFLTLRTIYDDSKCFCKKYPPLLIPINEDRLPVYDSNDLENILKKYTEEAFKNHKVALCLSGGIDSAILARFVPEGTTAYTFRCVVPGVQVTDEVPVAAVYAKECRLKQVVINIYWEDFEKYAPILMRHKGAPIHSIEVQIYKAALQAKKDGFDALLFGETADINFGGFDGLLSRDWSVDEFKKRYTHVEPSLLLKEYVDIRAPFEKYSKDGVADVHNFCRNVFYREAINSYTNACTTAGVEFISPYTKTFLIPPLDLERIRRGENKYLVREVFSRLYPDLQVPKKIPMPRPTNEWFKDWKCKSRPEFNDIDYSKLSGDQIWLIYALNKFLDIIKD